MKMNSLLTSCVLFFSYSLFAQTIVYPNPLNSPKFKGDVKSVLIYSAEQIDFRLTKDSTFINDQMEKRGGLKTAYFYAPKGLLKHIVSFRKNATLEDISVTSFFRNADNNLHLKIQEMHPYQSFENHEAVQAWMDDYAVDSLFTIQYELIQGKYSKHLIKRMPVSFTRYKYSRQSNKVSLVSESSEPVYFLTFDGDKCIEEYSLSPNSGEYELGKRKFIYEGDLLMEKRILKNDDTPARSTFFEYDENGEKTLEKIVDYLPTETKTIYVKHYQNGAPTFYENSKENKTVYKTVITGNKKHTSTFSTLKDGSLKLMGELIEFFDEQGNIIKKYELGYYHHTLNVTEYYFEYY